LSITDSYAAGVSRGNLRPAKESMPDGADPVKTAAKIDVIGAFAFMAAKHPLAGALCRLLLGGDDLAARDVVHELAVVIEGRAYRTNVTITRLQAEDMGKRVLAWYRHGTCTHCGGLGFEKIDGTTSLSGNRCKHCDPRHPGKVAFASEFALERLELAWFALAKVEREIALAGAAAMDKLAPRLEL